MNPAFIDENTLAGLEWPRLMGLLQEKVSTLFGKSLLEDRGFLESVEMVNQELALVEEMMALISEKGDLALAGVREVGPYLEHAQKGGTLEPQELLDLLATHRVEERVAAKLKLSGESSGLYALGEQFERLEDWAGELGEAFTAEGELSERAYPQLRAPRREITQRHKAIHNILNTKLRSQKLAPALQDKLHTVRSGRFVLPIKADFRGLVPGIVHDTSASGVTLFIEPQEVVEEGNALTMAEQALRMAELAILADLSKSVGAVAEQWLVNLEWIAEVDLLQARTKLAKAYNGHTPTVLEDGVVHLNQVANPLMILEGEDPVRNNIYLGGDSRCMIISGANTGGKTVLLKTLGLCALMVRFGLPLPAAVGSRCDFFTLLRADIGDRQSLSHSLSTFSAQIAFMAETLKIAGPGTMVLIDEILTGTAPEEGSALAAAALHHLATQGGISVATTHYGELKLLAAEHENMMNASVAFDLEKLQPTYRLLVGTPGASFAFPIARRYGLTDELVTSAEARLAGKSASSEALLTDLQQKEHLLNHIEQTQKEQEGRLVKRNERLSVQENKLREKEEELTRREQGEIKKELVQARKQIAGVIKELQNANSLKTVAKVRNTLEELASGLATDPLPRAKPLPPGGAKVGDSVILRSTGSMGKLEEVLDGGKRARVRFGLLPMEVDWEDLGAGISHSKPKKPASSSKKALEERPVKKKKKTSNLPSTQQTSDPSLLGLEEELGHSESLRMALQTKENTLDLRGLRLEEAWELTQRFFDQSMMKRVSPVALIHGHGTGKLKSGLRVHLRQSPYVAEFRPGGRGEGWDGVTVVALNV